MIFLKVAIRNLYNSQLNIISQKITKINDALLENILEKILENSSNWKTEKKIKEINSLLNKSNNYENIKILSKTVIKTWNENKIKAMIKNK